MEILRLKNVATGIAFPLIDATNAPDYFTGTAWGALTNASLTAYYSDAGGAWTIFNPVLTGTPTELGVTGEWYLFLTLGEMNHDQIIIKLNADEINEQTILINTVILTTINNLENLSQAQAQAASASALAAFGSATAGQVAAVTAQVLASHVTSDALINAVDAQVIASHVTSDALIVAVGAQVVASHVTTDALIAALNNLSQAQVEIAVASALVAFDAATETNVTNVGVAVLAAISGLNDLSSAQAQAACLAALVARNVSLVGSEMDLQIDALDANALATSAVTELVNAIITQVGVIALTDQTFAIVIDPDTAVPQSTRMTLVRGDQKPYPVLAVDGSGNPVDLTNTKIWFSVKRKLTDADASALITKDSSDPAEIEITNPTAGAFLIKFVEDDTKALNIVGVEGRYDDYWWDIQVDYTTESPERKLTPIVGIFRLYADVSRQIVP